MKILQETRGRLARLLDRIVIFLIKRFMAGRHHAITLEDGAQVVRMSKEFHDWVYGSGYVIWKETKDRI